MRIYEQRIRELSQGVLSAHQITIDLVDEAECLNDESGRDEIGSIFYRCGVLLEVLNPEYTLDKQILEGLKKICQDWFAAKDLVNRAEGKPRES